MFSCILKQLEEAESLLLELGASGLDLAAKIESIQGILNPETADALVEVSHAVKLPPEFFSENDIENLETLIGQAVSALNKKVFEKSSKDFGEHLKQTMHLFKPSMLQRMKNFFCRRPSGAKS